MNILHLNSNYDRSTIYKNMTQHFREILSDEGRVYFPTRHKFVPDYGERDYLDIRWNVSKVDSFLTRRRVKKQTHDLINLYDLRDFDYLLAYSLFSNGNLAYELYKRYSLPYFVIVQNTDVNVHFKKVPFSKKRGNLILENADKIIFISEAYKNEVINSFIEDKQLVRDKSVVIPFGIDDFWKENTVQNGMKSKIASDSLNLLYVGKVNKNKNVATIIDVIESLNNDGIKTILNIIGTIDHDKTYKKIMESKNVNWIPFVKEKKELLKLYRSNDIFIMPSYKESFGLVYGEAMSQGLPVIYTRGQGFDNHFEEGKVGYSVHPDNIPEIKNKIMKIVHNYEEISSNCTENVAEFYWDNICNKYQKWFDK